ncbi:MAG: Coq4 family protein [Pseudomonadota bacterium]
MRETKEPIVDRDFAERFMRAIDRPMDYGVYFLFHDWFENASERAVDAYLDDLRSIPGITPFLADKYIADPITLEQLSRCAPGTLGEAYLTFIVDNQLEANLGTNYRTFNEKLHQSGKLDRLPNEMSYMMLRGFQTHDFLHVVTGYDSSPMGELAIASFYLAQLRFPYHAMRMAVTLGHAAFVNPTITVPAMDAIVDGWMRGRSCPDLNFERWEEKLDLPLHAIQSDISRAA